MQEAQEYNREHASYNSNATQDESKSIVKTQVAGIIDAFVSAEFSLDLLKQEQLERERLLNVQASNGLCTIKTEPDSNLEVNESEADDLFVKEEMSLDVVKNEEPKDMAITLLKTQEFKGEERNHVSQYTSITDKFDEIDSLEKSCSFLSDTREQFSSEICNKSFSISTTFQKHNRDHTKDKPFTCDICHKTFSQKRNLPRHMKVHTGEKSFSCDICYKLFSHKCHLTDHLRVHTGEKSFSCDVCNKTFSRKLYLQLHERVHTGEKPFSCDICNKTFSRKHYLQSHERVHTGEKPFSCDICTKTFSFRPDLLRHMRVHTGEKPFSCGICNRKFSRKRSLKVHVCVHTGD